MSDEQRPPASVVVSLRELSQEFDVPDPETIVYLDPRTGTIVPVSGEEAALVEELGPDDDTSHLPGWQAEMLPELRRVLTSNDWLTLPSQDEFGEYRHMRRFALALDDERVSTALQRALEGRGAYRRFRDTAAEHGLLSAWFDHRERALQAFLAEWLEENGIAFQE